MKRGSHWVGDVYACCTQPGSPGSVQRVEWREVGRHGPVRGGWTGPLVTAHLKPKSTVCRQELKENQANSNRRPVLLPAEQLAGVGDAPGSLTRPKGGRQLEEHPRLDAAPAAAVNIISGAGVRTREIKQDGVTVSSNHASLCISVSVIF